jgi:hypothetical protein
VSKFATTALDDTGNLVMMHGDTLCYLYGIPHFRLNWYITLTLEDGPDGKKLIKQQHDHLLAAETFVYQLPLVGKWFEMVIPRVCPQQYLHHVCIHSHPIHFSQEPVCLHALTGMCILSWHTVHACMLAC